MSGDMPRIETVSVVGPSRLRIVWRSSPVAAEIDLSRWISTGGPTLTPLRDPEAFAKAAVADHGAAVTWDSGAGDLSIDAPHLSLIAKAQRNGGSLA